MAKARKKLKTEQSSMELASQVSKQVQIKSIRVIEFRARNRISENEFTGEACIRYETATNADRKAKRIRVRLNASVSVRKTGSEGGNSEDGLQIEMVFVATYLAKSMEGLEQQHFDAFGELNGLFNIWPYCREFVQSSTTRMGLSPLTLPLQHPKKAASLRRSDRQEASAESATDGSLDK